MAFKYYVAVDGQPTGPFFKEELVSRGISPDTLLWREGMTQWQPASNIPELADIFNGRSGQNSYGQGSYGRNPYNQNQGYGQPYGQSYGTRYGEPGPVTPGYNWLPWAIVATVCGFLFSCIGAIFGIIGIVNANKASNLYAHGLQQAGDDANTTAKTMTIIGLIIAAVGLATNIVLFVNGIGSAMAMINSI